MKRIISEEEGTTAILLAMVLVVLIGFAAIAVDGAGAWALLRQDQSGADTGALAGAIFTADRDKDAAMTAADTEIKRILNVTLTHDMDAAEWAGAWATCVDVAKPAEFTETAAAGSPCISFTDNLSKVRVKTPNIPYETAFASVIGFDQIDTAAAAEVNTHLTANGGVFPFGLPGAASGDVEVCLKSGPNPNTVPPCDGPATGNFGFLDFTQLGNDDLGTTQICNGAENTRLARNIIQGVDHGLGMVGPPPPAIGMLVTDTVACNDGNTNTNPQQVWTDTGNRALALHNGLIDGVGGLPGRLMDPGGTIVAGNLIDDTPLWDHFNANGVTQCGVISNHDDLLTCLTNPGHYDAGGWKDGVIFEDSIIDSARFGWVPIFVEPMLGLGAEIRTIQRFPAVYLQTTLWKCNASDCSVIHDPGETLAGTAPPGMSNFRVEAVSAIQFVDGMLPTSVEEAAPGSTGQVSYLLSE